MIGDTEGEVVGSGVIGDTDSDMVGSEVVGDAYLSLIKYYYRVHRF